MTSWSVSVKVGARLADNNRMGEETSRGGESNGEGVRWPILLRRIPRDTASQAARAALLLLVVTAACVVMAVSGLPDAGVVALVLAWSGVVLVRRGLLAGVALASWLGWTGAVLASGSLVASGGDAGLLAAGTLAGAAASVLRQRDRAAVTDAVARARAASVRDELTGLSNRRGLTLLGGQIVESARRRGDAVHCMVVDVTGLGRVNDQAGSAGGDEVIAAVAEALTSSVRATDVVARVTGDDFAIVGPGTGMTPLELERRVRDRLMLGDLVDPTVWRPAVSAGCAVLAPWDSGTLDTLLHQAARELEARRELRRRSIGSRLPRRGASRATDQPAAD